jgi:hypothetical protein
MKHGQLPLDARAIVQLGHGMGNSLGRRPDILNLKRLGLANGRQGLSYTEKSVLLIPVDSVTSGLCRLHATPKAGRHVRRGAGVLLTPVPLCETFNFSRILFVRRDRYYSNHQNG